MQFRHRCASRACRFCIAGRGRLAYRRLARLTIKQLVLLVAQISILCTVFGFGLKATRDDLLYVIRRPGLLARSLIAMFVAMPVLAFALVRLFDFRPVVEIALVALAISPVPPMLPQRERKAGGDRSYALGLLLVAAAVGIVVAPFALWILAGVVGRPLSVSP